MGFPLLDGFAPPRQKQHHHRGCGCHECKPPRDGGQRRDCQPKNGCDN
ncbi:hypothetical protein [Actinomycetospora chiangmaiensis]|nr:hypothetical protein [Actinomycetospora chiangmaiensis]